MVSSVFSLLTFRNLKSVGYVIFCGHAVATISSLPECVATFSISFVIPASVIDSESSVDSFPASLLSFPLS